jgi:hypothetical protein
LGQPISSDAFVTSSKKTHKTPPPHPLPVFSNTLSRRSPNAWQHFCTLPSMAHPLTADILLQTTTSANSSIAPWFSPFIDVLQATSETFLLSLTSTNASLPLLVCHLAFLPMTKGGLSFHDPYKVILPTFLVASTDPLHQPCHPRHHIPGKQEGSQAPTDLFQMVLNLENSDLENCLTPSQNSPHPLPLSPRTPGSLQQ